MKNCPSVLASLLIVLRLTVLDSLAQATYEPYTFGTLAGLAGNPGSTVWHSPDAGRTWRATSAP